MANKKFIEIKVGTGNSKKQVDDLDRSMVKLGRDTDDTSRVMGSLTKVATALTAALSVSQVIAFGDAWTVVNNKLANSIRTGEQLVDVTQRVFDISQETRSSLDATATLYARLERATREYNVSAEELTQITKTINQGFIVSGATAQEAENAVIQLAQGLSAGALRGEEFNSVNEQGNRIIVALSASLGVSVGKMRELAAQGKLTTDVVVKGLLEQKDVIENEFNNTITTFSQNTQKATDNLTKFLGESTLVASSISILGDSMVLASENMDTFTDIAAILATLYIARLIPSAAQYATGLYATITAQTKATVTTNAYGQVIARTTLATNAATVAVGALRAGLALLGGPLGVLFIAATSLAYFALEADNADESSKSLSGTTEELVKQFRALSSIEIAKGIKDSKSEVSELTELLTGLRAEQEAVANSPSPDPQKLGAYSESIKQVSADLAQAKIVLDAFNQAVGAGAKASVQEPEKRSEAGIKQENKEELVTKSLDEQLAFRISSFQNYGQQILAIEDDTFAKRKLILEQQIDAEKFAAETQLSETLIALEAKRQALAENEKLTAEDRMLISEEFDNQAISAKILYEQSLTEITEEGVSARNALAQQERAFNLSVASSAFSDLLGLASGHSRKAFELAKAGAIGTAVIKGYDAAVAAWDAGMSTGGPWAPAVAAAYTAASLLKTGGLISGIKSAKYGSGSQASGGGGGTPNISTPGGGATSPSNQGGNLQAPTQIFDLRGITADTLLTGQSLIDILSQTEGVAVALDGVMQEGRRLGEIS